MASIRVKICEFGLGLSQASWRKYAVAEAATHLLLQGGPGDEIRPSHSTHSLVFTMMESEEVAVERQANPRMSRLFR